MPPAANGNGNQIPYDEGAADALLGAAMTTPEAADVLVGMLTTEDFLGRHQRIAGAIVALHNAGTTADPVTVASQLDDKDLLPDLLSLQINTPSSKNAPAYARRLLLSRRQRRMLGLSGELAIAARNGGDPGPIGAELVDLAASTSGCPEVVLEDVGAALDGDQSAEASWFVRSDGQRLLYAAAVNAFFGEPTSGKTTAACLAAVQVIEAGGHVLYLDFEDILPRVAARMRALGSPRHDLVDRFHYARPGAVTSTGAAQLHDIVLALPAALVVVDGVAESIAAQGLDENEAGDIARWWALLPRPLAHAGAAVVLIDHVPKSKEQRGMYARGSGAKLAAIDGVAYLVETSEPFSRTQAGRVRLVIAKDRPGFVGPKQATAASIRLTPSDGGILQASVDPPLVLDTDGETATGAPMREDIRVAVVELLEAEGPMAWRDIARGLRANSMKFGDEDLRVGLVWMRRQGQLAETAGRNRSKVFSLPVVQQTLEAG